MNNNFDNQYHSMLSQILMMGEDRADRTGVGTRSLFGHQMRFDLRDGFPLITTKKVHTKSIFAELLWMLSGSTNVKPLQEQGVTIWNEWARSNGDLGPIYGSQWRSWADGWGSPIDQISEVIHQIKTNPFSRRHIVSAWNPADVGAMALPPCHMMFQFYVHAGPDGEPESLSCQLYQRSGDAFLGVPFNIASYALLTSMVAQQTGLVAQSFVHTLGDVHIYNNHVEQVEEQLDRLSYDTPMLFLDKAPSIFDYTLKDIHIIGYEHHPAIKAPVAI